MACFVVPVAEAVVVSAVYAAVKAKEKNYTLSREKHGEQFDTQTEHPFSKKLGWLMKLLFGGAFLLAFEHLWHGEVVPWFPFLTAAADPGDRAQMRYEMSTVGVMMAVSVTVLWGVMVAVSYYKEKRDSESALPVKEN